MTYEEEIMAFLTMESRLRRAIRRKNTSRAEMEAEILGILDEMSAQFRAMGIGLVELENKDVNISTVVRS